ncbi:ATP-binding protein [Runella sp.]|uniref:ATP-binding protein n=1 Tax=Runella sp. TaxID=1960881 RepID=UPI003D0B0359
MDNRIFFTYKVEDRSYVSFIKREIHNIVIQAGFSSMRAGEVDIIVSELTSNLIKYANGGELIYRLSEEGDNKTFEIFCMDDGPGTNDITKMMRDGASSANTLGHGLGAIKRLSDFFQIYSKEDWGTVAYAKVHMHPVTPKIQRGSGELKIQAIQLPLPGEKVCGDGYWIKKNGAETHIFLGDGLGHGPLAYEAVQTAIAAFKECQESDPVDILRFIHQNVKKTRGLVGTVAILNSKKNEWNICGIGNITTRLYQGLESKNCISHNGIIGMNIPNTIDSYRVPADTYPGIIMYSDGIRNRWNPAKFPFILNYDSSIIASVIFKDNARRTDDMTILTGKVTH